MFNQPCQNVPAILLPYSTLDFTRSPLAGKGPGVCFLQLLCCLLLQNILTGLVECDLAGHVNESFLEGQSGFT